MKLSSVRQQRQVSEPPFFLMQLFRLYRQNYFRQISSLQLRMVEILETFVGNEDMECEGEQLDKRITKE